MVDDTKKTADTNQWSYLTFYHSESKKASTCTRIDCSGSGGDFDWFKIGLFGHDLTQFESDCDKSKNCDPASFSEFDGWAVGMIGKVASTRTEDLGFCFTAD